MRVTTDLDMSREEADYLFRVGLVSLLPGCVVSKPELIDLEYDEKNTIEIDDTDYEMGVKIGIETILNESVEKASSKKGLQHDKICASLS